VAHEAKNSAKATLLSFNTISGVASPKLFWAKMFHFRRATFLFGTPLLKLRNN